MALQGDLQSFALPDVLRLLAATGKSGRLEVAGANGIGTVVLQDGTIRSGAVSNAPHATAASDVVFEILRYKGGSFSFEEGDQQADGPEVDVESAIVAAEALVAEWEDIELVIPSMGSWVSMVPEIDGMGVHVSAVQWRTLAAVGSGTSVRELGEELALTDLAACRLIKDLADSAMVSVREIAGAPRRAPQVELDSFEEFEVEPTGDGYVHMGDFGEFDRAMDPMTELEDLVVDDRTVVMEDRDDALLPEPLPGEGVAYEGELISGTVDGHTFDHGFDAEPEAPLAEVAPMALVDEVAEAEAEVEAPEVDDTPFGDMGDDAADDGVAPEPILDETSPLAALEDGGADDLDDERGSLLKFLSTVKP